MITPATPADLPVQRVEGSVSGPSALSAMERRFCEAFVASGGKGTESALAAGYAEAGAHVAASRLLCRKRVADEIQRLCRTFMHAALPVAIKALIDIASDPEAQRKDRIKAANSLLERGGIATDKAGVQVNVGVQVNGNQAQTLIGEVWSAKQQRLSAIPPAMTDTAQRQLEHDIDSLAEPAGDDPGGVQVSGSPVVPVPTTSPFPPENSHLQRNPFDLGSDGDAV